MGVFEFLLAVVAVTMIGGYMIEREKSRRKLGVGKPESRVLEQLDALERRMQAVEEIVCSKQYDLRQEIDRLEVTDR